MKIVNLFNLWYVMGLWEIFVVDNVLLVYLNCFKFIVNELCLDLEYCLVCMLWFKVVVECYFGEFICDFFV